MTKIERVQQKSIIFNKEVFGNIFNRKRQLQALIKGVHRQLDIYPSSDLIGLERDLQRQYNRFVSGGTSLVPLEKIGVSWAIKTQNSFILKQLSAEEEIKFMVSVLKGFGALMMLFSKGKL